MGRGASAIRYQWMLIVAIVAGLVCMHHLAYAHTMPSMTTATATHAGHADPDPVAANPVAGLSKSTAAVVSPICCRDRMNMAGHDCMAVLTAITILVAALILATIRRRPLEPDHPMSALGAAAARAPPRGCAQLVQLCVLRC